MLEEDCFHLGVKTLLRNLAGEFLLLERRKGSYWDIPGGRVQKGESVLSTLRRELEEETGLKQIGEPHLLLMCKTDIRIPGKGSDVGLILSIYRWDLTTPFTPTLSAEHSSFGWFAPSEVARLLRDRYPPEFSHCLKSADFGQRLS